MDLDADLLLVVLDIGNLIGENLAVFERNALGDAVHVGARQGFVERHLIDFLLPEGRMGELLGQIAVVGEQQQSETVLVETPHRVDAFRAGALHQLHDGFARMRIVERSHIALGLVEHKIDLLFALHAAVVEFHLVGGQHLGAQLGDDLTVDGHQTRRDEIVGLAARAESRLGQKAVQAHFADLLFGREFRIGSRLVVVLPESGLIGFVAEPAVAGLFVREPTVAGGLVAEFTFAVGFVAELAVAEFLGSPIVAIGGFFAAGLIAERAARFVAVAVTFVRTGAVALPFVAETAARFVECRTVVLRKVGIVRRPLDGLAVIGRLLRIGSITLQTRATLDTLRRSGHGTLTLVASETRKHRGRVVFKVFHNQFECLRGKVNRIFRIKAYCVPDSEIKAAGRYKFAAFALSLHP